MKINYYTVIFNFSDENDWLRLEGSGISIEFKINSDERRKIMESLECIKYTEDIILNQIPINVTERLINEGLIKSTDQEHIEYFWEVINNVYLEPYRILLKHAGDTEKQRKALRDFFKPIRYRLRSIQTVMEAENRITIKTQLDEII